MMKSVFTSIFLVFILSAFQCGKSDGPEVNEADYLLFGTKYGKCVASCNKLYYIDLKELYQYISASHEVLTASDFKSKGLLLSQAKYNQYKNLLSAIPSELDLSEVETFGCPNCYDQGEIYIEYKKDNVVKTFRADTKQSDNPLWLQSYAALLKTAVEELSK